VQVAAKPAAGAETSAKATNSFQLIGERSRVTASLVHRRKLSVSRLHAETTLMAHLIPLRLFTLRAMTLTSLRLIARIAVLAAVLFPARPLSAQATSTGTPSSAQSGKSAKSSTARKRSPAKPVPAVAQPAPEVPAAPPAPVWPANKAPERAHIIWDSHGLKVEASNSSLDQILHEVATVTGAKIEGFSKDQRIYGTYGPGPAREVLSRLLDGSGYNVLMVGGVGDAPPRQIVLSTAGPAGPQPQRSNTQSQQEDNDVEADNPQIPEPEPIPPPPPPQETPQPTPIRNPFGMPMPQQNQQQQPMPPDQQSPPNAPPQ
jgi:hypothetical protein